MWFNFFGLQLENKPFIWPNKIWKVIFIFCEVCMMNLADVKANECISLYKSFSSEDMLVMTDMQEKKLL